MASIFVTRRILEPGPEMLAAGGHTVDIFPEDRVMAREELLAAVRGRDALLCLLTDRIDAEVMEAAGPQLKIISNYAVGFDNVDVAEADRRSIVVTNTPGVLTEAVAEHAVALMMAVMRRIPEADRFMRAGRYRGWEPELLLGPEMKGKTLGIVGLGRIGTAVADRAVKGLGMRVIYTDVKPSPEFEQTFGAEYAADVDNLLPRCDVVTIHVPLLESTRHLMNADRLKRMKPTAYLINTSRGPVVDEAALAEALRTGVIAGAALDVFENEPQVASGLAELENVVLTPHIASATHEARGAMARLAAQAILDVLDGKEPQNRVRLQKWGAAGR